jgi:F-type H+-transporting ATPase subunit a
MKVTKNIFCSFFITALFSFMLLLGTHAKASSAEGEKSFNVKDYIFHHLLDNYDYEFVKTVDGKEYKVGLPRILFYGGNVHFFANTEKALEAGWFLEHNLNHNAKHGALIAPDAKELIGEMNHTHMAHGIESSEEHVFDYSQFKPLDFSITRNVVYMLLACILLLIVFTSVARGYKKNEGKAPKGIQSLFEPIIVFVRDEIAKQNIGKHKYERFMPFLLTLFFFILFLNVMGMIPFSSNVSGNISVTMALALCTLFVVNTNGNKHYWSHIFWPPVPIYVKIVMVPLEILSIFTKPFALTIRLFANISGGHIIMLSLFALIFIFSKGGEMVTAGFGVGIFSTVFIVAISALELFVAFVQAFVFTVLTSIFIGDAVHDAHH